MQSHPTPFEFRKKVLEMLLEAYPEEARKENSKGRLPLHVHLSFPSSNEQITDDEHALLVETLIGAFPLGPGYCDENCHFPLHLALVNNYSPSVIESLLLRDKKSVVEGCPTKTGERRSISWVIENHYPELERQAIIDVFREELKEEDFRAIFSREKETTNNGS